MRIAKLTTKKKAWYQYPDDQDGARFEITVLTPGQQRGINSKVQKLVMDDGGTGSGELDAYLAGHLRAMTALTGWERVYDSDDEAVADNALKFTATNKEKLLNGIPGFEMWILGKLGELTEAYNAELEEERKNSGSSANG